MSIELINEVNEFFDKFPSWRQDRMFGLLSVDLILFDKIMELGIPTFDGFDEAIPIIRGLALNLGEGQALDRRLLTPFVERSRIWTEEQRRFSQGNAIVRGFVRGLNNLHYSSLIRTKLIYMTEVCNLLDMSTPDADYDVEQVYGRREGYDIFMNLFARCMRENAEPTRAPATLR